MHILQRIGTYKHQKASPGNCRGSITKNSEISLLWWQFMFYQIHSLSLIAGTWKVGWFELAQSYFWIEWLHRGSKRMLRIISITNLAIPDTVECHTIWCKLPQTEKAIFRRVDTNRFHGFFDIKWRMPSKWHQTMINISFKWQATCISIGEAQSCSKMLIPQPHNTL